MIVLGCLFAFFGLFKEKILYKQGFIFLKKNGTPNGSAI
ncbi:hypothetical protein CUZ99_0713 [Enterococcus faecium]|nr:hypothetical protein [Enterococcus faecium]